MEATKSHDLRFASWRKMVQFKGIQRPNNQGGQWCKPQYESKSPKMEEVQM